MERASRLIAKQITEYLCISETMHEETEKEKKKSQIEKSKGKDRVRNADETFVKEMNASQCGVETIRCCRRRQ